MQRRRFSSAASAQTMESNATDGSRLSIASAPALTDGDENVSDFVLVPALESALYDERKNARAQLGDLRTRLHRLSLAQVKSRANERKAVEHAQNLVVELKTMKADRDAWCDKAERLKKKVDELEAEGGVARELTRMREECTGMQKLCESIRQEKALVEGECTELRMAIEATHIERNAREEQFSRERDAAAATVMKLESSLKDVENQLVAITEERDRLKREQQLQLQRKSLQEEQDMQRSNASMTWYSWRWWLFLDDASTAQKRDTKNIVRSALLGALVAFALAAFWR